MALLHSNLINFVAWSTKQLYHCLCVHFEKVIWKSSNQNDIYVTYSALKHKSHVARPFLFFRRQDYSLIFATPKWEVDVLTQQIGHFAVWQELGNLLYTHFLGLTTKLVKGHAYLQASTALYFWGIDQLCLRASQQRLTSLTFLPVTGVMTMCSRRTSCRTNPSSA